MEVKRCMFDLLFGILTIGDCLDLFKAILNLGFFVLGNLGYDFSFLNSVFLELWMFCYGSLFCACCL